jgi:D-alanyl-D-alanine carboxypeptidase
MSSSTCICRVRAHLLLAASILGVSLATPVLGAAKHAALVIDANSGRVISEQSADEPRYPASLTKMMTLYIVFDLIEQKKLTYETRIVFSDTATRVQPTKLDVKAGDSITVMEAVKGLITKSANDASVALAEHIAGSEPQFAALMTQTARRIGMKNSTFKNAHGLPNPEQVTTARDMITLGLRLQDDFPKHYPLFSTTSFNFRGESHKNHNTLLLTYEGTDGIKTGFIGSSGFNLVANVRRGDKHVIGVIFGGASAAARNQNMRTLLNIALVRGATTKTRQPALIARSNKPVPSPATVTRPVQVAAAATAPATPPVPEVRPIPNVQVATVKPLLVAPRQPAQAATAPQFTTTLAPTPVAAAPARAPAAPPQPAQRPQLASAPQPAAPRQQVASRSNLAGPMAAAPAAAAATGPYQIQVGAYATESDARRQIEQVKTTTGALLAAYAGVVVAATANGKTVYRARYTGFDTANGGTVCNELRRRQIDCMVAKAE